MQTAEMIRYLTPAEQGIVAVCLDSVADLGDDDATSTLRDALYLSGEWDWAAADRLAYGLIHECKRS